MFQTAVISTEVYWCTTNGVEGATLLSFLCEFLRCCQVHALHCGRKIIRVHLLKFYVLQFKWIHYFQKCLRNDLCWHECVYNKQDIGAQQPAMLNDTNVIH